MVEEKIMVHFPFGLQEKKATEFVQKATAFCSEIILIKNEKSVDAKSIMGVMSLEVKKGEEVTITTDGNDEQEAIAVIRDFLLVENEFVS